MTRPGPALDDRVLGVLYGAACGDALGGPVEGLHHRALADRYGAVDRMLPYDKPPAEHAQFANAPGSVTDDTRLHLITCEAVLARGTGVRGGDLAIAIDAWRDEHREPLERAFIEEYHYAALVGPGKAPWGGHATNGAIMSNHVVGVLHAGDPAAAFRTALDLAYLSDGYGREAAAIHAAIVAGAFVPGARVRDLVEEALRIAWEERRDGPHWRRTIAEHDWARFEGRPNHELIGRALALVDQAAPPGEPEDDADLRDALYDALYVTPVGSDAGQTLAVAVAMLVRHDADPERTLRACVAYGRDNDSYASVAGAVCGALHGVRALPDAWVRDVRAANPELPFDSVADRLVEQLRQRARALRATLEALEATSG